MDTTNDTSPDPYVKIRPLKTLVQERLPRGSILQEAVLAEDDQIPAKELAGKVKTWLVLLRREGA